MARPTKYTKEYISNLAKELLQWTKGDNAYFLKKFALEKGFSYQRLSEFAKESEEFWDALKIAKEMQEVRLFDLGLITKNQSFVIFALKNVAGWRDSQDIEHKFKGSININFNSKIATKE